MITGLQLAILSGGLVGLGAVLLVARLLPVEPDLADALERVSSTRSRNATAADSAQSSKERLGLWGLRVLPAGLWVRTPTRELLCGSWCWGLLHSGVFSGRAWWPSGGW